MAGSLTRKGVLEFQAKNTRKTRRDIDGVSKSMAGVHKQQGAVNKSTKGGASLMGGLGKAAGVAAVAYAALATAQKAMQWAEQAAQVRDLERAFGNLSKRAGRDATAYLAAMDEAAQGTVAKSELMRNANTAMLLGVDADLAQLVKIAKSTSAATGQSVEFMFQSLVTGIGRQSRLILDNLGIIVDAEKANLAYAASLGKTAKALTETEKKQAFSNEAIRQGLETVTAMGGGEAAADPFARLEASSKDLGDALKDELVPTLGLLAEGLAAVNRGFADYLTSRRKALSDPDAWRPSQFGVAGVYVGGQAMIDAMRAADAREEAQARRRGTGVSITTDAFELGGYSTPAGAGGLPGLSPQELADAQYEWSGELHREWLEAMVAAAKIRLRKRTEEAEEPPAGDTPGVFEIGPAGAGGAQGQVMDLAGNMVTPEHLAMQTEWLDRLAGGMNQTREVAAEMGAGFMAMGESVQMAGDLAGEGMGLFVDATIAAARGSKGAYAEMGKAMLKWAADSLKGMAVTAASKAMFYYAESLALATNPLTAALAPTALAAAGAYLKIAAVSGAAAIGVGAVSANNAPSGAYYSQDQRDSMTGLSGRQGGPGGSSGGTRTLNVTRTAPTNITVIHNNYGTQIYQSEAQSDAAAIAEVWDTGNIYTEEAQ
jgi:hypothetical protein